jgi:hypothetical protein
MAQMRERYAEIDAYEVSIVTVAQAKMKNGVSAYPSRSIFASAMKKDSWAASVDGEDGETGGGGGKKSLHNHARTRGRTVFAEGEFEDDEREKKRSAKGKRA